MFNLFKNFFSRKNKPSSPGGTTENSPAFQRRDSITPGLSPEGTAENPPPISPICPITNPIRLLFPPLTPSEDVASHSPIKNDGPTASPSAWGGESGDEGRANHPNSKLNPQNSTFPLDPSNKRNGKNAKLPRALRDQINRAFDAGQSAVSIARELNKIPEVKAMLEAHFEGRPISPQNLSEWKGGGYRDWQLRQELILQHQEFAANLHELSQTAEGMANSLFHMLLLDYARLMKNKDHETPEDFEKKRKALSNQLQDITKLQRCDIQARNVEVQEGRLERDREKTAKEEFQKFAEWAENPAVRKAFILAPEARMAAQRRNFGMRPHPHDAAVLREVEADSNPPETQENQGNQTEQKPPQTENSEAPPCPGGTTENNPAFQRRDDDTKEKSPEGTYLNILPQPLSLLLTHLHRKT